MSEMNKIMSELAQYERIAGEISEIIDGLKDTIKKYMIENNIDTLNGDEHKAVYKMVSSSRIDTKALKNELPDIATRYSVTSETMRFTFK